MKKQLIKNIFSKCHGLAGIFCILLVAVSLSCSIENRLSKRYIGQNISEVRKEFGTPQTTIPQKNGLQLLIFENIKHLKAAKVSTHEFQYDQLESPAVEKKETYFFYIDQSGKVVDFKFERTYNR